MAAAAGVPPPVMAALARTHITPSQVSLLVAPADGGAPLVNLHTATPLNPASVMKLVTTAAALDVLGPAYTWRTPVWADGSVREGTLRRFDANGGEVSYAAELPAWVSDLGALAEARRETLPGGAGILLTRGGKAR